MELAWDREERRSVTWKAKTDHFIAIVLHDEGEDHVTWSVSDAALINWEEVRAAAPFRRDHREILASGRAATFEEAVALIEATVALSPGPDS